MPYPNEHACRHRDPGDFKDDSFRRTSRKHEGKTYHIIMGKLKDSDDSMVEQAYRYPKSTWSASEARSHCKSHGGKSFEAAKESKSDNNVIEHRAYSIDELRVEDRDDSPPVIRGHAAVFNKWSDPMLGFRERIKRGAFAKSIERKDDVRALFNHDSNIVLGRTKSGTLTLEEDNKGLLVNILPPQTQLVNDMVLEPIRRGDVDQMSFGFMVPTGGDDWKFNDEMGMQERTIKIADLFDTSPVTFPQYPQTDVAVRDALKELGVDVDLFYKMLNISEDSFDKDKVLRTIEFFNEKCLRWAGLGKPESRAIDVNSEMDILRKRMELEELANL